MHLVKGLEKHDGNFWLQRSWRIGKDGCQALLLWAYLTLNSKISFPATHTCHRNDTRSANTVAILLPAFWLSYNHHFSLLACKYLHSFPVEGGSKHLFCSERMQTTWKIDEFSIKRPEYMTVFVHFAKWFSDLSESFVWYPFGSCFLCTFHTILWCLGFVSGQGRKNKKELCASVSTQNLPAGIHSCEPKKGGCSECDPGCMFRSFKFWFYSRKVCLLCDLILTAQSPLE